jgi:diguanylate cyclase (GGDEF)-like protein
VIAAPFPLSAAQGDVEALLEKAHVELNSGSSEIQDTLEVLGKQEKGLSEMQRGEYYKLLSSFYAFRGMYKEQIEASNNALKFANDPDHRAIFLYYISDGYSNLGKYEEALQTMNDSLLLLPKLSSLEAKADVLQSAVSLMSSFYAYDDAKTYAQRLIDLPTADVVPKNTTAVCLGSADMVEIAFLRHDGEAGRNLLSNAVDICDKGSHTVISRSIRALEVSDRLRTGRDQKDMKDGVGLLDDMAKENDRSDYAIQLSDAIANRYLALGQLNQAEAYGHKAYTWASGGNVFLRQQTNATMAEIARAEGKLDQALNYLKVSNQLWAKIIEERSHRDLAFLRMKFQAKDQSIQLELLSKINKLLTNERELQDHNKHTLELLVVVTALLLGFVSMWLWRTWCQKNDFRTYSQIDGLTKISNRSHFIACAHQAFKDARGSISVIVFDMDQFKLINDTYGHAAGDWVLKTVSSTIAACLRSHDMFGRLGGEEFAICLPHTSEQEAAALAERCRGAVETIDSSPSGEEFGLTASFGIAIRPPNGAAGFEEVLAAADRALYQAKDKGRNCIVPYGEVLAHAPLVA